MKGKLHPRNDATLNPSGNESIRELIERVDQGRRRFVQGSASATLLASAGGLTLSGVVTSVEATSLARADRGRGVGIGFQPVPADTLPLADQVAVPDGYTAKVLVAWGDPIVRGGADYKPDASNSAAEQLKQFGMHNDGMHFFPFPGWYGNGVLCVNNEYTDEDLLYPDGQVGGGYTLEKCRKSQSAHGVSLLEIGKRRGEWAVLPHSRFGRRITANTPVKIAGPAAGHALLKANEYDITLEATTPTGESTDGLRGHGTINNCANGITPWGTYLTCEENWNGNFGSSSAVPAADSGERGKLYNRYGVTANGNGYLWHTVDERFDIAKNPNEPNMFGWIVEIDPFDPDSKPVKRTALGRFKHESCQYVLDKRNNLAFYMGDDERNEYIYKFVCAEKYRPGLHRFHRSPLDNGTLFVARFTSDTGSVADTFRGQWIPLLPGTSGIDGVALRDNPNFAGADDAEVLAKILIKTRMAADAVGATMMDRPEWTGARPRRDGFDRIELYCTLTNNNRRGSSASSSSNKPDGSTTAGSSRPAVDAANPRANNIYGHIIRWREDGDSVNATGFEWDLFVQCGDSATTKAPAAQYAGNIVDDPDGSCDFGAPDGLWFDPYGRLWVQTDQVGNAQGDWVNIGANCMVCADPETREMRRFLTGPANCEVTGITMAPDGRTLFVGIQHPGEGGTAANPTEFSAWPSSQWATRADGKPLPVGRPRSAVVAITRDDGGIIGA